MAKIELEIPDNIWVALCMVAEEFGETPSEVAADYIEMQLEADVDIQFARTYEDLTEKVKTLLEGTGEGTAELKV